LKNGRTVAIMIIVMVIKPTIRQACFGGGWIFLLNFEKKPFLDGKAFIWSDFI